MNLFLMVSGHRWENQERGNNVIQCFRNEGLTAPTTKKKKKTQQRNKNKPKWLHSSSRSYCTKLLPTAYLCPSQPCLN